MRSRARGPATLLGALSTLATAACTDDACEDRSFDPPPEPEPGLDSPPTIVGGEWIGTGVLELQFSGAIGSVGDLDPRRFAILAWDAERFGDCYENTFYRALSVGFYNYYSYSQAPIAEAWVGPEDDTILRLRMTNTGSQCPTSSSTSVAAGVMLVYTNSAATSGPELLDVNGEPLSDIGPSWAVTSLEDYITDDSYLFLPTLIRSYVGHLPNVDALVDIPCP